jgi:AcrR family transcriptional regulator
MRVRTDERRQAILAAAWEVFKENGFERTTMSDISEQVGGSKATLYGYFQSKEQLFAAVLEQVIGPTAAQTFSGLWAEGEIEKRLLDFARIYLEARLSAESIAVERALIEEGTRSGLGERLRQQFVLPHWRSLASVFNHEMRAARMHRGDPIVATWHFRGMIEQDLVERRLHGDESITDHEVERAASEGVAAFLRAYARPTRADSPGT